MLFDKESVGTGKVPSGEVFSDGSVRVTAGAVRAAEPQGKPRDAVVGFVAPVAGTYRVAGRAKAKRWGGGGDAPTVVVAQVDRRTGRVDEVAEFAPDFGAGGPFKAGPVELAVGQFLVLRLALGGHHGSVGCTFADLTVTCLPTRVGPP